MPRTTRKSAADRRTAATCGAPLWRWQSRQWHCSENSGSPKRYVAKADSGNTITRVFCGECGTPLYVQVSTRPDIVGVRVCTFDDPSWFRPDANIFVKSAQPWDHRDPAVPAFATYPSGKAYPSEAPPPLDGR